MRIQNVIALASAPIVIAGCGSIAAVETADLEGFWIASQARFVEIAAPKRNNEDIILLGFEVEMQIDAAGNFVLTIFDPEGEADSVVGILTVTDGRALTLATDNGAGQGEAFLQDDRVAFRLEAGLIFNFGDGRDVESSLLLVMDREGAPVNPL